MATIHLTKGAPKSTRLDEAGIRKRAATKGDAIVDVKPGEEVVSVNVNWTVDKYVALSQTGHGNGRANGKSSSPNGKSPAVKMAAPKTSSPKGKTTPAKKATSSPKRKAPAKSKTPKKKGKK